MSSRKIRAAYQGEKRAASARAERVMLSLRCASIWSCIRCTARVLSFTPFTSLQIRA